MPAIRSAQHAGGLFQTIETVAAIQHLLGRAQGTTVDVAAHGEHGIGIGIDAKQVLTIGGHGDTYRPIQQTGGLGRRGRLEGQTDRFRAHVHQTRIAAAIGGTPIQVPATWGQHQIGDLLVVDDIEWCLHIRCQTADVLAAGFDPIALYL